ncbi:MAG: type III pantothenate kinase [Methylococcales bacterium]|nr:type III pantothenate kinase [Methylococcales bacterium]
MNLLIDIGNTRLKWAFGTVNKLKDSQAISHQNPNFSQQLIHDWQALESPDAIAISSVSSDAIKSIVLRILRQLWADKKVIIAVSTANAFGVTNSYLQPQKLGVDRWLALIASYHYYQQAAWVIDCGTAITLDLIDDDGQHKGGVISSGLQLMKSALSTNTTALSFSENKYSLGLANKTDKAIFSGTLYAAVGLIEQLVNRQSAPSMCILTGGDAHLIAQNLSFPVTLEPDLVLKGLVILTNKSV